MSNYLYKYRPFDTNSLSALVANQLWFSTGNRFNDPFDCTENIPVYWGKDSDVKKLIQDSKSGKKMKEMLQLQGHDHYEIDAIFRERAKSLIDNGFFESESCNKIGGFMWTLAKQALVYCLSKDFKNNVMWSHYGNYHKGFCIRFKKDILLDNIELLRHRSVVYKRKGYNVFQNVFEPILLEEVAQNEEKIVMREPNNKEVEDSSLEAIIFRKYINWEYEREYRLVYKKLSRKGDESRPIDYPPEAIDKIYFGAHSSNSDKRLLMSALDGRDIEFQDVVIPQDTMTYDLVEGQIITLEGLK